MDDPEQTLNTHDLVFWVTELHQGRADAAEPTLRKIVSKVEGLAAAMFRRFPRVGRFVDVDDLIQNSLIRLLATLKEVRPTSTGHFYSLANTLIRRELLDLVKHYYGPRGHGTNLAAGEDAAGEADSRLSPSDAAELERMAAFHRAIEELPIEQREVVGLIYYHGWTQAEISNLFHVSVRTVQRWQEAALAALRRKVGDPSAEFDA